jgi:hypothetical protein
VKEAAQQINMHPFPDLNLKAREKISICSVERQYSCTVEPSFQDLLALILKIMYQDNCKVLRAIFI